VDDLDKRLEAATRKRDALAAERQKIEGRLEASKASLAAVEEECRSKGVDPDQIDAAIAKLEAKYAGLVEQLEREVEAADAALAPFMRET
jgi:chromosome segregation ATPase